MERPAKTPNTTLVTLESEHPTTTPTATGAGSNVTDWHTGRVLGQMADQARGIRKGRLSGSRAKIQDSEL